MVLRDPKDPLNTSRGIMGPLENSAGVQNNRGRLKQRFDLIRKLGQGTYGKVQLGIDKETGQEVAIKTIKKSKIETEADLIRIRREIQIMSSVRHPNIIHIYEVFENREKMVLVMEYAAGGELYDYLNERKILQEDEARRIFRQIASAAYYCHKNKICHRDLKLENILLDEKSNAKIADFGLSNVFDDVNMLKTFCGSPLYASPEIVKGTPYSGPEVDCWSLGVLLYTLVYGAMPFDGSNFKRLVKQISAGDYYEPKKPAEASPLIRIMLTVDPRNRAKVEDICAHPWINQGFDKDCLQSAEELAKQTPVRLDVLLTLAPNINHPAQSDTKGSSGQVTNHRNDNESDSALNEPPKKAKLHENAPSQKDGVPAPPKPKRKTQSKTKSKTTPLMLDLIQDVVEEENEDVEMHASPQSQAVSQQQHPVAGMSAKPRPTQSVKPNQTQDNDDECDTLSEISEIQTLAEDLDSKPKERVKSVEGRKEKAPTVIKPPTTDHESRPKGAKQTATTTNSGTVPTSSGVTSKSQRTEPPPPTETAAKKVVTQEKIKETSVTPTPPEVSVPEPAKPLVPVVKKKVIAKPKSTSPAPTDNKAAADPSKKATEEKVVEPPKLTEKQEPTPISQSPDRGKQSTSGSDEKSSDNEKSNQKKLIRQRSGSVSDVSPTRVERRNSKVISQKTAELIQNLETKTSTGSGSGKDSSDSERKPPTVKKLVIPNFKVSDNKNKFETKPPRPITSSIMSASKAAFEAKAQQSQTPSSPPVKLTPTPPILGKPSEQDKPKEKTTIPPPATSAPNKPKSPSPTPNKKEESVTPIKQEDKAAVQDKLAAPENKESPAVSPKTKPKVVKKLGGEVNKPSQVKAITPEPPTISEATVITTTSPVVVTGSTEPNLPTVKQKPIKPGKIFIPPGLQQPAKQEIKPVVIDTGNGTPKPIQMVVKGQSSATTPLSPPPSEKLLSKLAPQNKEQAAKKISSVINKIVTSSSGSGDEANKKVLGTPTSTTTHKTEVTFPVAAAPSAERVIPIKFEQANNNEPPTPGTAGSNNGNGSRNKFPPRFDSFKRFDSASSIYSRQNSSDTESCSLAPPKPEPIRKSPREFLIPIKLEASGVTVTPKEDIGVHSDPTAALSEDDFRIDSRLRSGRFGSGHKHKRYSSLLSDSSVDEDLSASAAPSRRDSSATNASSATGVSHGRSRSQGDEAEVPAAATFKRYRAKRPDLDRSDSFSSNEEDDEDFFEVFTADSLFSNLLDRVRNLTKRINREGSIGPNWPSAIGGDAANFGLWNPSSSLRDLMQRAPSETRSFGSTTPGGFTVSTHRSFSRDPSVAVTLNSTGSGHNWRRSLSRDVSGESDVSGGSGFANQCRSFHKPLSTELFETTSVRSLPVSLNRRSPSYLSQRSEPYGGNSSSMSDRESVTPTPTNRGYTPQRPIPAYGRTMSSTEYSSNSNPITRNLPFRRSLKSFDHNPADYSMDSVVGAIRGLGQSLIDSPATFDPESYLRQMRCDRAKSVGRELPINREPGPRECSVARMSSINEQDSKTPSPLMGNYSNGYGINGNANVERDPEGKLTIQDKMNNYTQYYNSLTGPSSNKRFQLGPSQIHSDADRGVSPSPGASATNINNNPVAIGLARLRPNTMFETTSLAEGGSPQNKNKGMISQSMVENKSGGSAATPMTSPHVNGISENTPKPPTTGIPKWPGVSIQQYRPLSISSFPSAENQMSHQMRASSMSRVISPPPQPTSQLAHNDQSIPIIQKKEQFQQQQQQPSRTTSVERITRFLERKSVPREMSEQPDSRPLSPLQIMPNVRPQSPPPPDNKIPPNKTGKSKFLHSLEKKWEKFTTHSNSNGNKDAEVEKAEQLSRPLSPLSGHISPTPREPSPSYSVEISPDDNKISESVLLRRALSPEKKLKKFGSGTVNFMLGKFKRFEEVTPPPPAANKFQIQSTLKPPAGSKIGRRVQSAYVGAASDSVLTLPQSQMSRPNFVVAKSPIPQSPSPVPPESRPISPPPTCNGSDTIPQNDHELPDPEIIRSGEAAQQKRRSLRLDIRAASPATPLIEQKPSIPIQTMSTSRPNVETQLCLSVKTNIFPLSDPKSSQIPRPNGLITLRCTSPPTNGDLSPLPNLSKPELITSKSMSPPQITIHSDQEQALLSPSMLSPNSVVSISDSGELDDSSVCSDRNNDANRNLSSSASVLDDEESVSDRIFRKSFYSRFNSIDRGKRSASLNAASAARKGIYPINTPITNGNPVVGRNSGGNLVSPTSSAHSHSHHHHHHHHHQQKGSSQGKSPTPAPTIAPAPMTLSSTTTPTATEPTLPNGISTTLPVVAASSTLSVLDNSNSNSDRAPSPHSLVINKYNPNPLFKELITDDFKSDIEKKTEYSRRVTSKLSKLLKEIETDLNTCSLTKQDDEDGDGDDNEFLDNMTNGIHSNNLHADISAENNANNNSTEHEKKFGGGGCGSNNRPPIGVGLKALTPPNTNKNSTGTNPNFRKYVGSKTTNLGGSINAVTSNSVLSKRNLFNRESSLQPDAPMQEDKNKGIVLKQRASSVQNGS